MRTIKFKGWDGKKMLPPEDITISPDYRNWLGKIDCELMQFTGLYDEYGKEIYEGDIIIGTGKPHEKFTGAKDKEAHIPANKGFIVLFHEGSFKVKKRHNKARRFLLSGKLIYQNSLEVIGNIYENPELL